MSRCCHSFGRGIMSRAQQGRGSGTVGQIGVGTVLVLLCEKGVREARVNDVLTADDGWVVLDSVMLWHYIDLVVGLL